MNKLFEPYLQLNINPKGIGLGLYITYNLIVDKMKEQLI